MLLNSTLKMILALKIFLTFWRKTAFILPAASESNETEFPLSFPIRSTLGYFAMLAKFTKANTSQSSQRKFLTRFRKFWGREADHTTKLKTNRKRFVVYFIARLVGMGITGEHKVKRQKNGNEHYYIYYHCTRKNKLVKCKEPYIRQESLDKQISSLFQNFFERRLGGRIAENVGKR